MADIFNTDLHAAVTQAASIAGMLFWAMLFGGLIGIERQWRQRLAGVRTNALVALGAAAFTMFAHLLPHQGADSIARVAAQVVSGIGFLGAGVIMRDGFTVHGLTTAATLWCSAAVGVLVGADMTLAAGVSASMVLAVNLLLRPVSRAIDAKSRRNEAEAATSITVNADLSSAAEIRNAIAQWAELASLGWISWSVTQGADGTAVFVCQLSGLDPSDQPARHVMRILSPIHGVQSISLDQARPAIGPND